MSRAAARRPSWLGRLLCLLLACATFCGGLSACSGGSKVKVDDDPVLVLGQQVFGIICANCHGAKGEGGSGATRGPVLKKVGKRLSAGQVETKVRNGGIDMPPWKDKLSEDQIKAVARYATEVL